jgi:hypothetical protein
LRGRRGAAAYVPPAALALKASVTRSVGFRFGSFFFFARGADGDVVALKLAVERGTLMPRILPKSI